MNRLLYASGVALLSGCLFAQTPGPSPTEGSSAPSPAPQTAAQAEGPVIPVVLDKGLDSKKLKEGDEVIAKIPFDLSSNGQVILPKDTKINGRVTKSSAKSRGDADSTLAFVFDKANLKDGKSYDLAATVQAIAPPQNNAAAAAAGMPESDKYGTGGSGASGATVPSAAPGQTTVPPSPGSSSEPPTPAPSGSAGPQLKADSVGVFGMKGLTMNTTGVDPKVGAVITSDGKSVKLDGGSQLLLKLTAFSMGGNNQPK